MKIKIDTYEIDIKVKGEGKDRYNVADTKAFLNEIAVMYANSAEFGELRGTPYSARRQRQKHDAIYNALDAMGYYDEYKE